MVGFKLLLILLSFSVPFAIMLYIYVDAKYEFIKITKLEKMGNQYQIALENIFEEVIYHKINTIKKNNFKY